MKTDTASIARKVGRFSDINDQHGVFLTVHEDGFKVSDTPAGDDYYTDDPCAALLAFAGYCENFADAYAEAGDAWWADEYLDAAEVARRDAAELS